MITGVTEHKIEDVRLSDILIQHAGGGTRLDAARQLEEKEKEYPEPNMFGNTPAHGLLIRHAENIEIWNWKVIAAVQDARPCFRLDDVEGADFSNVRTDRPSNTPVFVLENVKDFSLRHCHSLPDTQISEANHKEL